MNDSKAASFDESQLRRPLERPYFYASVFLSLIVVGAGVLIAALAGMPLLALLRNRRDVYVHGQSIRFSRNQFAPVYEILQRHCQRLGMTEVPGLYITSCCTRIYLKRTCKKRWTSPPLRSVTNLAEYGSGIRAGYSTTSTSKTTSNRQTAGPKARRRQRLPVKQGGNECAANRLSR